MAAAWWGRVCRKPVSETDSADMRATLCRQNSCFCPLWRRLYPSSQANHELLEGCLQLLEPNFGWVWYSLKDRWSTAFPRDKNIHLLIYQPLLWRLENSFLKPVIESGWFQGQREEYPHVTLKICTLFSCFPSCLPPFSVFHRVCWSDVQGENHCSLLRPQALLGKQTSSTGLLKQVVPT